MNKDGTVKLGDLNVSKVAKMGLVYTQTGTPYYASPEVWQDKPYDSKSDIWSLGVVLYEMATLDPPFTDTSMKGLCKKVLKGAYPSIPSRYSKDLSSMIKTLLQVSPTKRPSCKQILHMPAVDEHLLEEETYDISQELLNTIKFPRNIKHLSNRLPKSQYQNLNDSETKDSESERKELYTKNSQPVILTEANVNMHNDSHEMKRELDKYEAIAEIERKYGAPKSRRSKKQRQIPKTTPSSINGIPDIYMKYKQKARLIAESLKNKEDDINEKKNNYIKLKEKYIKRAKEVEQIEKQNKLLLHKRAKQHNVSTDAYQPMKYIKDRSNYHYDVPIGRNHKMNGNMNSKSEDHREDSRYNLPNPILRHVYNYKGPETSKAMDNLSIDDADSRKARILQHAREIREAVSLNREKATGIVMRIADGAALHSPNLPKWWG